MPVIRQPLAARYDRRSQITTLHFDSTEGKRIQKFYLMGAVSWPEGTREGFALLAGQNMQDQRILPFREFRFRTVGHWISPSGEFLRHGFAKFLAEAWTDFQCRSFFFSQHEEIHRRYSLECYDLDLIEPKPEFIRVLYANQDIGDNLIDEHLKLRQLVLDDMVRPMLAQQLKEYKARKGAEPNKPFINEGTHALRCLLAGFIYNPPPPPRDEVSLPIEWERRK